MPTDDEIRSVLAEKLMGMKPIEGFYYYGDDTWNPLRNIEQAMMCAKKCFGWFQLQRARSDGIKWRYSFQGVRYINNQSRYFNAEGDREDEAIARACYSAVMEG